MQVSVIITCFNRERWIARAIRSALTQNYPDNKFEVIVVDDGSTDNSPSIIKNFSNELRVISHSENKGLPAARNSGIRAAKGRYVIHLDSDDYISEEIVPQLSLFLNENPDWGAVSCDYNEINEQETLQIRKYGDVEPIACGIMFRTDWLVEIGLYNEEMLYLEDEEFRERFQRKFKIGHCNLPLYRYMRHADNMTNDKEQLEYYGNKLRCEQQKDA